MKACRKTQTCRFFNSNLTWNGILCPTFLPLKRVTVCRLCKRKETPNIDPFVSITSSYRRVGTDLLKFTKRATTLRGYFRPPVAIKSKDAVTSTASSVARAKCRRDIFRDELRLAASVLQAISAYEVARLATPDPKEMMNWYVIIAVSSTLVSASPQWIGEASIPCCIRAFTVPSRMGPFRRGKCQGSLKLDAASGTELPPNRARIGSRHQHYQG